MLPLLYYQVLLNFRVINTEPTISILLYFNSRYFVINLEFSSHNVCSSWIFNCFFCSFCCLVLNEYPTLASPFLVLLAYYLVDLTIFLHEVFEINKRQSSIKSTHIHYSFFLLVISLNPSYRLIFAFFSLLSLFLTSKWIFLINNICSNLQTPL